MTSLNVIVQKIINYTSTLLIEAKEWVMKIKIEKPKLLYSFLVSISFFLFLYFGIFRPPSDFPLNNIVTIPKGTSLESASKLLEEKGVVLSSFWFRNMVILLGGEKSVVAGGYFFKRPRNAFSVAQIVTKGEFGIKPLSVTIPEGASLADMAVILNNKLNDFDIEKFLELTNGKEGYLFPDTYYFLPVSSEKEVIDVLSDTFNEKIKNLEGDIREAGKNLDDIVIMASIVEREANTTESRRFISGVLWKRIELGMPLQVDVTFDYINGKNTFDLTLEDLEIDSPYNTYQNKGLPPGPIGSPSLDSLLAAIYPTESDFLYFLADGDGMIHYSRTFEEHKKKKRLYLY